MQHDTASTLPGVPRAEGAVCSKPKLPIRRYVDWLSRRRFTGRVVYVTREWSMPEPQPGAEWQLDTAFDVANELRARPGLKVTLIEAVKAGAATVQETVVDRGPAKA